MGSIRACLNCKERHPACHDTCERYHEDKMKLEKEVQERRRKKNMVFQDYKAERRLRRG